MNTSLSAVSASLPLRPPPRLRCRTRPAVQVGLLGPLEGRKELLEPLRAQAGERLECVGVASDLVVADHGSLSVGGAPNIMP